MSTITLIFGGYSVLLMVLAWWSRGSTRSLDGYFIAGKRLPPWVVAFSTNATGESGWLLLGLTGMGYAVGAQAFWVVAGEVTGIALAWLLISRRLKRLADDSNSITVPDVLIAKLGDKRHILRAVSVVIILVMVGTYVAAQMVAGGKALSSFLGFDYRTAVVLGAAVIITYTMFGGYKAVAWTDLVQGILMLLGLIFVPIVAILYCGGLDAMTGNLEAQDPRLLSLWGPDGKGSKALIGIASFLAIGIPFLGVPQLLVRFMSARSEKSLVPAMVISIIVILLFDIGAVTTGMAGRALFPGLADPERILPVLASNLFPPVITGVLLVVVIAAIMSTVDSLLILASSAVVRDYLQGMRAWRHSGPELARTGKWITLVIGLVGMMFAQQEAPLIFWFVLFSWSGLGAAFGPVMLCILWDPKTTWLGAVVGMLGGFLTTVSWVLWIKPHAYELLEIVPGFLVGMVLTIAFSRLDRQRSKVSSMEPGSAGG